MYFVYRGILPKNIFCLKIVIEMTKTVVTIY